jgi:hypothetical protein
MSWASFLGVAVGQEATGQKNLGWNVKGEESEGQASLTAPRTAALSSP